MKSIFVLLSILILNGTTATGQDNELKEGQIQVIKKLINAFTIKSKTGIADLINYPLKREYPLKDVKNRDDFIRRFDDIFDKELIGIVAKSKISDWSEVGWRGIMLGNGQLWTDDLGKIEAVNYQSPKEKELLVKAIQADKNQLPKTLRAFEKPFHLIFTKNYKIRIDRKGDGMYRYAAWKIRSPKSEPDILIENGVLDYPGSSDNHTITFKNNSYTYVISIGMGPDNGPGAVLEVLKEGKRIWTEGGEIKRN